MRERLLHRLLLRVPKATLDILGAYGEALFRAIFGLELDGGKEWRRKSLGAGVNQPEHPWEVRERLLHRLPFTGSESDVRHSGGVRGGPLSGDFGSRIRWWKGVAEEITGSRSQPARAPVGGERTAASQTAFTGSESDVRHSGGVRGGPLSGDFWFRIRWWKGVAKEITARVHWLVDRLLPAFTGSESDVRHSGGVRGGLSFGRFLVSN